MRDLIVRAALGDVHALTTLSRLESQRSWIDALRASGLMLLDDDAEPRALAVTSAIVEIETPLVARRLDRIAPEALCAIGGDRRLTSSIVERLRPSLAAALTRPSALNDPTARRVLIESLCTEPYAC